jgi:hypothetical protein
MACWSKARLREHKPAIATIVALLLLWLLAAPASASPLEISGVSSGNITETTAAITWTTDLEGNSTVNYGNSTELGTIVTDSEFVFNHSITLTGLDLVTLYYCEVSSTDSGNNTATSPGNGTYHTFTTDPYPPKISGITVGNITDTSAIITWTTDRLGNSTINYGNTSLLGLTAYDSNFLSDHSVTLTGLSPATFYYFDVWSTNLYSNTTVDSNGGQFYTFTTLMPLPTISGVNASNLTDISATITWTTDQLGNSSVYYGTTTDLGSTASSSSLAYNHAIDLTGLLPNTLYYYKVSTTNTEGRTATSPSGSDFYTFKTAVRLELQGWGWCTNQSRVVPATLEGYALFIEREHAPESFSMHAWGNLTLLPPDISPEIISLDMYGSRVRTQFYLRQEVTGESSTFTGTWITGNDTEFYMVTSGLIALPNPEGEAFKTARLCFVLLRTPDVDVPQKEPGGFAADLDTFIAWSTKYFDRTLDSLVGSGVGKILGEILAKIMILIANIRALGAPYFP